MAEQDQGMSTTKKVAAGAAVGLAVPAAVGVARKIIGSEEGEQPHKSDGGEGSRTGGEAQQRRATSSGRTSRASATSSTRRSRSTSSTRSRTGGTRRSSPKSTSSSSTARAAGRTKEQLYRQAQRLKIEGRSKMSKAQLERAIARARS